MSAPEGEDSAEGGRTEIGFDLKEQAMDEAPVGITISDPSQADNPLVYVNDSFARMTGYAREEVIGRNCRFLQGEETSEEPVDAMREAIENEEPVTVELLNYRKNGESFWNEVTIAPLTNEDGEVTNFVGFQSDVTERKEAEFAVERERENLDHLLDRISGLLSDVTGTLVESESREVIERAVCDRIAEAEPFDSAWIGERSIGGDTIEANAWAGVENVVATDLRVDLTDEDEPHPIDRAFDSGEVVVSDALDPEILPGESGAIAAVPLTYRETNYGVLVVHTSDVNALNDRETTVLGALGRAIATALNAHESKRIISADNVVEIELSVRDRDLFFVDLSATLDCTFEYRGSVYRDGSPLLFFATDGELDRLLDLAADRPEIDRATVVGSGSDTTLIEFELADTSVVSQLAERGAQTRSMSATGGEGSIEIELPASADARAVVEAVQERYPDSELLRYREQERPPTTTREFISGLEDRLTERQLTALKKAYVSGYYEWKRTTSGDEIADSMDISRSTFHQHLRAAERKLIEEFFDRQFPR